MSTRNPQKASEDFSFGSKAFNEFHHGRNKDKKKSAPHKLTRAKIARDEKEALRPQQEAHDHATREAKRAAREDARIARILGDSGSCHAVKIARSDLKPFDFNDVDSFEARGWQVIGAPSVSARAMERNPAPLGGDGQARALVLLGPVNRKTIKALESDGLDAYPAPKAYRLGIRKNPEKSSKKKVYQKLLDTTRAGQAWNELELSNALALPMNDLRGILRTLAAEGLAHSPKNDLFGPVWIAGAKTRSLLDNPASGAKATKKAQAWYGKENLVTNASRVSIPDSLELVEVGTILAIEYESKKFDGRSRAYRHDVTKKRTLYISTDGTVLVIKPGFKITKRGIEG